MKGKKNPFPGVTRVTDRHGKVRWRYRHRGFSTYLSGAYGSAEWRAAYEAAVEGAKAPRSRAEPGSIDWLIGQYVGSLSFHKTSDIRKKNLLGLLNWVSGAAGHLPFDRLEVRHVEALMARKSGPAAANNVKKTISLLYNYAGKKLGYVGPNPARFAERMKTNTDGYHTWSDAEVELFLARHAPGSKARLVLLLALNTGMARKDLVRVGRQHLNNNRITYRRHKTSVPADLPVLPELAEELRHLPADRMLFITQDRKDAPYTPESLGNWFKDRCREAGVPGALHGLRKAGATRLANAGATEWEIASYLAHTDTSQASIYARKANRARLADSGFAKLAAMSNVSNLNGKLDKRGQKPDE
ncbi:MAG: hypothetical protein AcusKO_14720 [Acuticoccus sp.]